MLNSLENEIRNIILEKFKTAENNFQPSYGCDFNYSLFESENIDGTFFYCTYESKEFLKRNFDYLGEIYQQLIDEFDFDFAAKAALDFFDNPERFACIVILTVARNLLNQLQFISDNWDNKIEFNSENIEKITNELNYL